MQTTHPDVPNSLEKILIFFAYPFRGSDVVVPPYGSQTARHVVDLNTADNFRSSPFPIQAGDAPCCSRVESFPQLIKLSAVHFVRFQLSLGLYRVPHPQQSLALVVIPISASSSKQRQTATIIMSCRRNKKKHVINLQCNHGRLANCAQRRISSIVTPFVVELHGFEQPTTGGCGAFFFCSR